MNGKKLYPSYFVLMLGALLMLVGLVGSKVIGPGPQWKILRLLAELGLLCIAISFVVMFFERKNDKKKRKQNDDDEASKW